MKVTSAAEVTSRQPWRMMLFGEPGIGKTTFASQAPNPVIIACPPDEVISLAKTDRAMTPVLPVRSWSAAIESITYANKMTSVDTIIFDTFSHLAEYALKESLSITKGKLSQATWTNVNGLMRDASDVLLSSPKNLILVSHLRHHKDDEGSIIKVTPDFSEGLLRKLTARMNAIFYFRLKGQSKRELATAMVSGVETKNRYDLPTRFEDPTFNQVVEALEAYKEKARTLHAEATANAAS